MKDINKMRLGVIREIKNIHKFFDHMEKSVKMRNPETVQTAYIFIKTLAYHMNNGDLVPLDIELHKSLLKEDNNE